MSTDFYWVANFVSSNGVENFALATADGNVPGVPFTKLSLQYIASLGSAIKYGFIEPSDSLNSTRKQLLIV